MGFLIPAMTQQKLDTQRDVVKNERRWSMDNQPYGTWWEKLPALAFPPEHPFHHSLIGSMEDLSEASLADIEAFFETYYTPDNAVLSIAGDFESTEARMLVERYFGPLPRGKGRPALRDMSVPPRFGDWRRETVPDDVALPRLFLALRSPVFGSEEYYAASTLGAVLGMGKASRLQQRLVREREIASDATVFTLDLAKGADLLVADVTARPGVAAERLEVETVRELDALRRDGVRAEEVERALAMIETALVQSMQSASDRADKLSQFATYLGDPALVNVQADRYQAVTVERVNAFARRALGEDNRVSLLYVPRAAAEGAAT
jgi:predicted Zn-dependent peptidase